TPLVSTRGWRSWPIAATSSSSPVSPTCTSSIWPPSPSRTAIIGASTIRRRCICRPACWRGRRNGKRHSSPLRKSRSGRARRYAQRTGKRLFLQPAFFERGRGALFTATGRRNMVYFNYPWSEEDNVEIELPEGFALDSPDAPQPFSAGTISKYDVHVLVTQDKRKLIYKRAFFFG